MPWSGSHGADMTEHVTPAGTEPIDRPRTVEPKLYNNAPYAWQWCHENLDAAARGSKLVDESDITRFTFRDARSRVPSSMVWF